MPEGRLKSHRYRRVSKRLPSAKTVVKYEKRKPSKAVCAKCGIALLGVPRARAFELKRMAKSKKRPNRPYGGVLCSSCSKAKIKEEARIS